MYKKTRKYIDRLLMDSAKFDGKYIKININTFCSIREMLLAQKEDRKECLNEMEGRVVTIIKKWLKENQTCPDCLGKNGCMCALNPTPSPLELPKIHNNFSSIEQYNWAKQITDEVKKLYQYIKEKKK